MRRFFFLFAGAVTLHIFAPAAAYAGDSATIVLKSGTIVFVANGYKQLIDGMKELKKAGSENFPIEINIEGTTFFVNLGEVALLCRDRCTSLEISRPKAEPR